MMTPNCFLVTWIFSGIEKMLFLLMSAIFCLNDDKKRKQVAKHNPNN